MIRLLLLAAAGFVGYRLAREYIDEIPSAAPARGSRAHSAPPQKARKR